MPRTNTQNTFRSLQSKSLRKLRVFTDRYPLLGPIIWIMSLEYFVVQIIVAWDWHTTPYGSYSWRFNTISDLANTACGTMSGRPVCSPLHGLMNLSFLALGLIMAFGSLLIYQEFKESRGTLIGFSLMALAGLGTIMVGAFPENTIAVLHVLGASLPFFVGNVSLLILSFALYKVGLLTRIYTFISGFVPLVALGFFVTGHYGPFGIGGLERLVGYPQTVWLIFFGCYMSRNHYLKAATRSRQAHTSS